jgi:aa3 type cytochrome c oxidase subunit IV
MAAHGESTSDYQPGTMDISAHQKAWIGFTKFVKWSMGFIILVMAFLALFRTH